MLIELILNPHLDFPNFIPLIPPLKKDKGPSFCFPFGESFGFQRVSQVLVKLMGLGTLISAGDLDSGAVSLPSPPFSRFYQLSPDPFSPEFFIHHHGGDSSQTSGDMEKWSQMESQEAHDLTLELGDPNFIRAAGRKKANPFPDHLRFTRVAKLPQKRGDLRGILSFRTSDCGCFHDGS
jgi:hypothetical protein